MLTEQVTSVASHGDHIYNRFTDHIKLHILKYANLPPIAHASNSHWYTSGNLGYFDRSSTVDKKIHRIRGKYVRIEPTDRTVAPQDLTGTSGFVVAIAMSGIDSTRQRKVSLQLTHLAKIYTLFDKTT